MPTKVRWKIQACFILYFKFWEGTSVISYKIQLPPKDTRRRFNVHKTSQALKWRRRWNKVVEIGVEMTPCVTGPVLLFLNGQNLLSVTKVFGEFPVRRPLKHFSFKNLLTKSCESIFYVSAVNYNCHCILKGFNYRFSGLVFRTYFKNSYFNTGISNYL